MVYFTRRLLGVKKAGHTGTLDPMATGVLPVLIGGATKLSELLMSQGKSYKAGLKLGITTDTMDTTGKIIRQTDNISVDFEHIKKTAGEFIGEIEQVPPIYSAIKVGGKKLYEYALSGKHIQPEPRKINIYSLNCEQSGVPGEYILNVDCSKGTYIRSLCHDIGEKLCCGAVMSSLERTRSGDFDIKNSFTPEVLEELKRERGIEYIASLLIPCEDVLKSVTVKKVVTDKFYTTLAKNGAEIYLCKLKESDKTENLCLGDKALMYDYSGIMYALGEIKDYNGDSACKVTIPLYL